jgi:hypothetical protein
MRYRLMATYRGVPYEVGMGPSNSDVVLFAACPPPEELGFEPATGHWRKPVIRAQIDALWESRPVGMFRGEPCMVLDDPGERLHIAYLGTNAERATSLGYWQVDRGVFELLAPREEVTELTEERVEKPLRWGELAEATGPMATYPYGTAPWPVAAPHVGAPLPPDAAAVGVTGRAAGGPLDHDGAAGAGPADLAAAEVPPAEVPATETLAADAPAAVAPASGAPVTGVPPAKAPVSDTPLADALMAETQRARRRAAAAAPQAIAPQAGVPQASAPLADRPMTDNPMADHPAGAPQPGPVLAEDPMADHRAGTPQTSAPLVDRPMTDDPMADHPAGAPQVSPALADDPIADRPAGAPQASAPLADRPMTDGVMADDLMADEPMADDLMADEPVADDPMADHPPGRPLVTAPLAAPLADNPLADPPPGTPRASVPLASVSPETVAPAPVPVPSAVSAAPADRAQAATGSWPTYPSAGTDLYSDPIPAGDALSYPEEDDPPGLPVPPGFYDPPDAALAGIAPVGDMGGRAARRQRVPTREIFCELADLASIPRAAYALETETDGAICLLPTPDGFDVFIAADGARHELRSFAEEEAAYFYLFGVLAADAIRSGALAPTVTMANPHGGPA